MEKLGSVDGRAEYTMLIENQKVGLAELLAMFPSCVPPLDSILNVMPSSCLDTILLRPLRLRILSSLV